ncbi:hypothetical protein SP90_07020 [Halodesulfovibrio spirochaetisodalis]|uniref:Uncharacterized protein n=1 Tax=Halodesulfovibrio spirochaetisodalis TaxID=1560234 RepID=A0A1B7XEV1_9BACT|nr:hypothetical protein SP90_07020 [Halodesulfovibrio spirochaetisodalis]
MQYHIHIKKMASGDYEVHKENCEWCPPQDQLLPVGEFPTAEEALKSAKKQFPEANGCHHCLPDHYKLR